MNALVLGAGMMGRAIAYDLAKHSQFDTIALTDNDNTTLASAEQFLKNLSIEFDILDINNREKVKTYFKEYDVAISAVPYMFNNLLTNIAVETQTHFLDLGGNTVVVQQQKNIHQKAKNHDVTIIPDCGLAPGLVSVVTQDIVTSLDTTEFIKIRVGGLPLNPQPPLNYQLVFSPNGLINEYVEDAIVLDHGNIITKKSMTDIEKIIFPKPFGELEAFITSGGCSTLPYTYKGRVGYLDYKTIRYPGHCEAFKPLLTMEPRKKLIDYLMQTLPSNGKDVVLMKIFGGGHTNGKLIDLEHTLIDYCDEKNHLTSMMRTTAYPVSIAAQMIERGVINDRGVFCSEEIIPHQPFFQELEKRNIIITKEVR
ncbi:MAG: saccharopine dehydrogenase NADP-binding domain-containing protein [Candidatus Thermoplasmatota archaeon]|nr:saccharopine dehydrogenase NADP-binding domain-containing protein [Candidatus Thermoplasmatota archaeon]